MRTHIAGCPFWRAHCFAPPCFSCARHWPVPGARQRYALCIRQPCAERCAWQSALALPHPSEAIGRALQAALEKYRISIDGGLRIAHWLDPEPQDIPERWIPLARLE